MSNNKNLKMLITKNIGASWAKKFVIIYKFS